jgi:hypothetical protein
MKPLRRLSIAAVLSLVTATLVGQPAWSLTQTVSCTTGTFTIDNDVVTASSSCTGIATIPNGVTSIGYGAFGNASSLTSITIPSSVTSISEGTFYEATSLAVVEFEAGSELTSIGDYAFYDARSLSTITIPSSVTSIGGGAFQGTSLSSIIIPSSVTSIGGGAFRATPLTSIIIPSSVTTFGRQVFQDATSLGAVVFEAGSQITLIDYSTFDGATSLTSVTLPDSLTWIRGNAFKDATSLSSIAIPATVTRIDEPFSGATSLTSVTIPASVTTLENAFNGATSLTTINFEGNAPTILGSSNFNSVGSGLKINIGPSATGFVGSPWDGLTVVTVVAAPAEASEPAPPSPYAGPLPSNYSSGTASTGDEVTITGRRLNLITSCTIDGVTAVMSNQSADSFTIMIPEGVTSGLKDLVMTGPAGKLTAQGAFTVQEIIPAIIDEAFVSSKLNAGSFNGYVAVYAKGHKGKTLSWKIAGKWFKTTITSDYQVFQRRTAAVGLDVNVHLYINAEKQTTKTVRTR